MTHSIRFQEIIPTLAQMLGGENYLFNDKSRAKEAPFTSNGQFQTGKSRRTSMYIYSTQLYFTGLPVREASQCLSLIIKRNHVSI
jgi:hypothetical protein